MRAKDVLADDAGEVTPISTAFLRDYRLSIEAHGLMARLAALTDDFEYTYEWICEQFGIGPETLDAIYAELLAAGYTGDGS